MNPILVALIGIAVLLIIMFVIQLPVGFAMAFVGALGVWYMISGEAAFHILGTDIWLRFSSYGLTVIPLFTLMGFIAFNSGLGERLYFALYKWIGHWRGGLAIATIGADELFAAICGSNTATVATMGAVALPQMKKYNYDPILSSGAVATGGTLGVVMPPSVVLIVIGLQTEQSIIRLFLAGIFPALLLGVLFILTIFFLCRRNPDLGPAGPKASLKEKMVSLGGVIEAIGLFVLVIGGLYLGWFTPTEAGAVGAVAIFLSAIARRRLSRKGLFDSIRDSLWVSCFVFVLITGATIFGRFLTVTRLPFLIADWAAALPVPRLIILIIVLLIYFIGGCFMDALGFLVLTMPIFFPLGLALGYDPIWYSIILTMVTTMGAITPPVGVNLYIVKAMNPEVNLKIIFRSVLLFLAACAVSISILILFPQIALYIPNLMQ